MAYPLAKPDFYEAEAQVFRTHGLQVRTHYLRPRNHGLSLRAIEAGVGDPILLLHGIGLSAAHWAPVIEHLTSARCIAIDMPGHGGSDGVDFRNLDLRRWHVDVISECLDELGIDSAHVIGHSYGGMFGLWFALDLPQRVRSVVSIGAPAVAFGARPDATLRMMSLPGLGFLSLSLPIPRVIYRRMLSTSLGRRAVETSSEELVEATYLASRRDGFARTVSTYLREQFLGARATPQRYVLHEAELRQLQQPVLFIWGNDDHYQSPEEGARRAAFVPAASFRRVPGGHEPWLDEPALCGSLIARFVSDPAGFLRSR